MKKVKRTVRILMLPLAAFLSVVGLLSTGTDAHAACTYTLNPTSASFSYPPSNGTVSVTTTIGCTWAVVNSNGWITINSATNNTNSGSVAYSLLTNSSTFSRTGTVTIAGQPFKVTQSGAPCSYALSAYSRTHGYTGTTTGLVTVITGGNCPWNASTTNSWIRIISTSGIGTSSNITYMVTNNPSLNARIGAIVVSGQTLMIYQSGVPCNFNLSPSTSNHGYGGSSKTILLTAASNLCAWTISNSNAWVRIDSATNGTGVSNNISYTVFANPSSLDRTGFVVIADQLYTVTQDGAPCTPSISPHGRNHGYTGTTTGIVNVAAAIGCAWSVYNSNTWITIDSGTNGVGSNVVRYSVLTNFIMLPRTGSVVIASQLFTLSQDPAPCMFTLSTNSASHSVLMGTGTVSVTTSPGCAWQVSTVNGWITILSSTNNSGSGTVTYRVDANSSSSNRSGVIMIDSKNFTVNQQGNICNYKLSTTSRHHGHDGASSYITLTTSNQCSWSIANPNGWIHITSSLSGMGTSNIYYTVDANPTPNERTGLVMIADQTLTITEDGFPCDISISPANRPHGNSASGGSIDVTASSNVCPWQVINTNAWITITYPTNGMGIGTTNLTYTIPANPTPYSRTGLVFIADQVLTISQRGFSCSYSISPSFRKHGRGATNGTIMLTVSSNLCPWQVVNTNGWIRILSAASGTGSNKIDYAVDANPNPMDRTGLVMIADQVLTLAQYGVVCSYSFSPDTRSHGYGAGGGTFDVMTAPGCSWEVINSNDWIHLFDGVGTGSDTVSYTVDANPSLDPRTGTLVLGDAMLTIMQDGFPCAPTLTPDTRYHSAQAGIGTIGVSSTNSCAWTPSTVQDWITITATNTGSVGYSLTANTGTSNRLGRIKIGSAIFNVIQFASNCDYTISPDDRSHGYTGSASNSFSVIANTNCAWSVLNSNGWITLFGATNGSGLGTVSYAVGQNLSLTDRVGVLFINGRTFTLTQHGYICTYSISPTNRNHGYTASGGNLSVIGSSNTCPWNVSTSNNWIHFTSTTNGIGSGNVSYTIDANAGVDLRTAYVLGVDQVLTITQDGIPCNIRLSPTNRTHGFGATNSTISVDAATNACPWPVENTNSWITVTSPGIGMGEGLLSYSVDANFSSSLRSGVIMVADQMVTISQLPITNLAFKGTTVLPNGQVHLALAGGPGGVWELQASSNLKTWTKIANLTNVTARLDFDDVPPPGTGKRFYRAVKPATAAPVFSFTGPAVLGGGQLKLTLQGGPSGVWELQGSSDLKTWTKIANLTNTTGTVDYTDSIPPSSNKRFYRAVQP